MTTLDPAIERAVQPQLTQADERDFMRLYPAGLPFDYYPGMFPSTKRTETGGPWVRNGEIEET